VPQLRRLATSLPERRPGFDLRWCHVGIVVGRWRNIYPSISVSLPNSHSTTCSIFISHWRYIVSSVVKRHTETRVYFGQSRKQLKILEEQISFGRWDETILRLDDNLCNWSTTISFMKTVNTLKSWLIVNVAKSAFRNYSDRIICTVSRRTGGQCYGKRYRT
jgi:hypothetical protein